MSVLSALRRWFGWDIANFKGILTALLAMLPALLTSLNYGAYRGDHGAVWAVAIGFATIVGGAALWKGFTHEWRELSSINEQIRAESLNDAKIRDRN